MVIHLGQQCDNSPGVSVIIHLSSEIIHLGDVSVIIHLGCIKAGLFDNRVQQDSS